MRRCESAYFGGTSSVSSKKKAGTEASPPIGNRHDRKESERFNPDQSRANRFERVESERFRSFSYEELTKRDKCSITLSNVPGSPRHALKSRCLPP